jgi:hypothetical protein
MIFIGCSFSFDNGGNLPGALQRDIVSFIALKTISPDEKIVTPSSQQALPFAEQLSA